MGAIEDVRKLLQDLIAPDLKEIKTRLDHLEKQMARQHDETMRKFDDLQEEQCRA